MVENNNINHHDLDGDGTVSPEEFEIAKERWETKRKIVWLCLSGIFIFGFLITGIAFTEISIEKLKIISNLLEWGLFGFTSIIGAYFGVSAYSAKVK